MSLYFAAVLVMYSLPVYVPDEGWFMAIAAEGAAAIDRDGWFRFALQQENALGYGSLYWILLGSLAKLSTSPLRLVRMFALLGMLSVPATVYVVGRRTGRQSWAFAILVWLTFPMAWWSGKLVGPELFSVACLMLGLVFLRRMRPAGGVLGALLFGMAIGVKANAAPAALFLFLMIWIRGSRPRLALLTWPLGAGAGFLLGNPFMVLGPARYLANVGAAASRGSFDWDFAWRLLRNKTWLWDAVLNGGWFDWGIGLPAWIVGCVLLLLARPRPTVLAAFGLALLMTMGMFALRGSFYGWYWFPLVACIPFLLLDVDLSRPRQWWLGLSLLALNAGSQADTTVGQVRAKLVHFTVSRKQDLAQAELSREASRMPIDSAVLFIDPAIPAPEHLFARKAPLQPVSLYAGPAGFTRLIGEETRDQTSPPGSRFLFVESLRFLRKNAFFDPRTHPAFHTGQFAIITEVVGEFFLFVWVERVK